MNLLPKHPGTIEVVDEDAAATTTRRIAVEHVPEDSRFARGEAGWVPVVRIVRVIAGDGCTIREYGPKGELLASTIFRRAGIGEVTSRSRAPGGG